MTIRATAAFTRSPMPARSAARTWNCGRSGVRQNASRLASGKISRALPSALRGPARRRRSDSPRQIVAVKGLGGFHLLVAARNETAVRRLRERKHREEKPFALMFPSLASRRNLCEVSPLEERLLRSPEAPIVLLRRKGSQILNPKL